MKVFLGLLLLMGMAAARADLYRWVDPQTGAIKFSNVPPPASQAGVEVVPYGGSAVPPKPAAPAGTSAAPVDPALDLDKRDPAGAERRRAEAQAVLQRLLRVEK